MADAEADVSAGELNVDLAARDEIHRMGIVAAAHDDVAGINPFAPATGA
jgi:hypothetical protein